MTTPSIGFGPLKGPDLRVVGGATDAGRGPGEILDDGSVAAPLVTQEGLIINTLTLTTGTYADADGNPLAWVRAQWSVPAAGEHPTDQNRVGDYRIRYTSESGQSAPYSVTEGRDVTIRGLRPQFLVTVDVRARANKGVLGPPASASIQTKADNIPPPIPSAPTITGTLRGASVVWDGTFVGGAVTPPDYRYIEIQLATASTFATESLVSVSEKFHKAGRTSVYPIGAPGFVVYARLRSIDRSGNASDWSAVATGTGIPIVPEDIGERAITEGKLADAAVTARSIIDQAVTTFKMAPGSVTTNTLADLAITTAKIGDRAIEGIKMALGTVKTENLGPNSVDAAKLADLAVTSAKVAEAAIITSKISNNAVDNLKLLPGAVTTDKVAEAAITTDLLAKFAVHAQNVGFGIGGGNLLDNSSFENKDAPLQHWENHQYMTLVVNASAMVHGEKVLVTTYSSAAGVAPALA